MNEKVPWHENLKMSLLGCSILAFVVLIPVVLIALIVAAFR